MPLSNEGFRYVLISPVKNEEDFIEKTIQSVIKQTILPVKWIIISDGSTDKTDEIVKAFEKDHSFIKLMRKEKVNSRNFGSKVEAFNFGYRYLENENYDFIGNLDGDIGMPPDYYETIMNKFKVNPKLGIAGGVRLDYRDGKFNHVESANNSVAGGFQLFKRECFEKIGGYRPLPYGGIDAVAEAMSRMYGWEVKSFKDIELYHYKPTGSAHKDKIKSKFRIGIKYYLIGYHPIFPIVRFLSRLNQKPYVIGSLISISGFLWASVRRYKRAVPKEFVNYLRSEQSHRLKEFFKKGKDPARMQSKQINGFAK